MRKLLAASSFAGMVLVAASAQAADMSYPVKAAVYAPAPIFSWTGFYIGANVGYGWADSGKSGDWLDYLDYRYCDCYSYSVSNGLKPEGWFGGGQIGYNYQFTNNVVIGIEADFEFSDTKDSLAYSAYSPLYDYDLEAYEYSEIGRVTAEIETFGTIRARLGYAFDRFLPYITGGLAWGNVKVTDRWTNYYYGGDPLNYSTSSDDTLWGWTIGGGLEYAITDNWTVKAEYLYADLGSVNFDGSHWNRDLDVTLQTVKFGVNYKF